MTDTNDMFPDLSVDEVDFYLEKLRMRYKKIDPADYYLSYSGGKDSHLLYWFQKVYCKGTAIADIPIVGVNTYMEHEEILKRITDNSDVVLKPDLLPFEIKEKYGSPCFSKVQDEYIQRYQRGSRAPSTLMFITGDHKSKFKLGKKARNLLLDDKLHKVSNKCCEYLKKRPAALYQKETGRRPILGLRQEEGLTRKANVVSCFSKKLVFTPIWDLSNDLLEKIIEKYGIEVPDIYKHISRTGCMGCPYGSFTKNTQKELKLLSKNRLKFVKEYFKESYEVLGINIEKDDKDDYNGRNGKRENI